VAIVAIFGNILVFLWWMFFEKEKLGICESIFFWKTFLAKMMKICHKKSLGF
jgi:hypothetical protein